MGGIKFRRQQPIGNYIVDFVSFEKRLIIELDGGQHMLQKAKDEVRDECFRKQGYEIIRIWDNEVFENFVGVLESIRMKVAESPSPGIT